MVRSEHSKTLCEGDRVAAPRRVSSGQIEQALAATSGCVQRASAILGISKNSLYKRLSRMDLHPDKYRKGDARLGTQGAADAKVFGVRARRAASGGGRNGGECATATFPRAVVGRRLDPVSDEAEDEKVGRLRESRNWFLRPEQIDKVRQAKFDLQAKLRTELSDSKVLERFLDEKFDEWIREALA
jgi:hypothetical protein